MGSGRSIERLREIAGERGWARALADGTVHVFRQAVRAVVYVRRDFIIKSLDEVKEADCDADIDVRVVGPEMHEAALSVGPTGWRRATAPRIRPDDICVAATVRGVPAQIGEDRLEVAELPRTAMRSRAWGVVRWGWRSARAAARREWQTIPRASSIGAYVHAPPVTAPPRTFAPLLRYWARTLPTQATPGQFVTTFHPDELLSGESAGYGLGNMLSNLREMVCVAESFPAGAIAPSTGVSKAPMPLAQMIEGRRVEGRR